jgi:hypothetical protein
MKPFRTGSIPCLLLALMLMGKLSSAQAQTSGKFIFSNTPFAASTAAGKQQFKSSEFIYGRLELPSTVEEFFKMPKTSEKRDYPASVLVYRVYVEKNGEQLGSNRWPYIKLTSEQRKNKFLNFDILPQPSESTTMTCALADFSSSVSPGPLYSMFDRDRFPSSGKYTIKIDMQYWTFDPYNPDMALPEAEWNTSSGKFEFDFNTSDLPRIQENNAEAQKLVKENSRVKAMNARGLPKEWNLKSAPSATGFTEKEMIAMFLDREATTCKNIKAVIYPVNGPTWVIVKNDSGIPLWRWHNQTLGFFAENNARCFYITGDVRQQYEGGGKYAPAYFQWTESLELNCKNIPKATAPVK